MIPSSSADLRDAERVLVELEHLIARGEGDGDAADALRDEFVALKDALPPSEQRLLEELAGDLDSLSDREIPDGSDTTNVGLRLDAALRNSDISEFMRLVRAAPAAVAPWMKALWRGRGWSALGCHYAAATFLERAIALNPTLPPSVRALWFEELYRSGHIDIAAREARHAVEQLEAPPVVRLAALAVLYQENLLRPPDERTGGYRALVSEIESVLAAVPDLAGQPGARTVTARAHLMRAYAYEHLGRADDARVAFDEAVRTSPDSDATRVARGAFLAATDREEASKDFAVAIDVGTSVVAPYALLAFFAIDAGRLDEGESLARAALDRALAPVPRALILEILAAAFLQRMPPQVEEARLLLNEAVRLAPHIGHIQENLARVSTQATPVARLDSRVVVSAFRDDVPTLAAA